MNRHQGGELPFFDQGHANRRTYPDVLESGGFLRRKLLQIVVDDEGPAGAELSHRLLAEVSQTVVTEDMHRARRRPIPADGEAVLVGIHIGIGAARYVEMLAKHPGRHRHHAVGITGLGRLLVECVQEKQPGFVLPHGRLRTPTLDGRARALGNIADKLQLFGAPFARPGIVQIQQRHHPVGLGDRHVDERARRDRLESLGTIADARVFFRIGTDDGLAPLEVFDVAAIVAEAQHACEAQDARCVPVADNGDGLG